MDEWWIAKKRIVDIEIVPPRICSRGSYSILSHTRLTCRDCGNSLPPLSPTTYLLTSKRVLFVTLPFTPFLPLLPSSIDNPRLPCTIFPFPFYDVDVQSCIFSFETFKTRWRSSSPFNLQVVEWWECVSSSSFYSSFSFKKCASISPLQFAYFFVLFIFSFPLKALRNVKSFPMSFSSLSSQVLLFSSGQSSSSALFPRLSFLGVTSQRIDGRFATFFIFSPTVSHFFFLKFPKWAHSFQPQESVPPEWTTYSFCFWCLLQFLTPLSPVLVIFTSDL